MVYVQRGDYPKTSVKSAKGFSLLFPEGIYVGGSHLREHLSWGLVCRFTRGLFMKFTPDGAFIQVDSTQGCLPGVFHRDVMGDSVWGSLSVVTV